MYFVDSSANIVRCLQTFPGKRREIREIPTNIPTPSKSIPKISRFYNNKMFCIPKLLSPNRSTFQQRNHPLQSPEIPLKNRSTFQHQKKKRNPSLSHSLFDPPPPKKRFSFVKGRTSSLNRFLQLTSPSPFFLLRDTSGRRDQRNSPANVFFVTCATNYEFQLLLFTNLLVSVFFSASPPRETWPP